MPNIERLTRLVHILEALPPERGFDLGSFASVSHSCGTTACALGYAALDPTFMAEGFRLALVTGNPNGKRFVRWIDGIEDFNNLTPDALDTQWFTATTVADVLTIGPDPSLKFFGIDGNEFYDHFMGGGYRDLGTEPTAQDVANKLRQTFGITT